MKVRRSFNRLLFVLPILLLSCAIPEGTTTPPATSTSTSAPVVAVVNHPRPELTADFGPFEDAGCPANEQDLRYCEAESPLAALGCDRIRKPTDLLGGLEPPLPIAVCLVEPFRHTDDPEFYEQIEAEGEYFYRSGGLMPVYTRYVVSQDDQFRLIKTEDEFRDVFAPIETSEEALSYSLAVRKLSAYYGLEPNPEYEYFVDQIEDTHVEMATDGYLVHLFYYQVFGCGPHETYAIVVQVTEQGHVEEVSEDPIYKDPSEDDLCVD
jgi:hypothetical protein